MSPATAPYNPALQLLHADDPAMLYWPAGHNDGVTEPDVHAKPAGHKPVHAAVVNPGVLPYSPALHGPLQALLLSPDVAPYSPALQLVHMDEPPAEYCPGGQIIAVADTEPAGHA